MNPVILSLFGVAIGACIFASLLWSAYQSYQARRGLQIAHIALVVLTLGGVASLSFETVALSQISGLLLAGFSISATMLERGWTRLLPLVLLVFAAALVSGLPFADG